MTYSNIAEIKILPKNYFKVKIRLFYYNGYGYKRTVPAQFKICFDEKCLWKTGEYENLLPNGTVVTVEVPESWGTLVFNKWTDNYLGRKRFFIVNQNIELEAEYVPVF